MNVTVSTRAVQFTALIFYCIFADESMRDIVKAVELFPQYRTAKVGDKTKYMTLAWCVLRYIQGVTAASVTLLLVITAPDVVDSILNFTAVNFISGLDEIGYELALWGKYGRPKLENEAKCIGAEPTRMYAV